MASQYTWFDRTPKPTTDVRTDGVYITTKKELDYHVNEM